ncbi:MAG TPA: protein kinase [Chloroflexota bacterium]|nr:protein kinase [Chloroflexota bacterium]
MTKACLQCGLLHPAGTPCFTLALPNEKDAQGLQPGATLAGRYHILRTIHHGGMSLVYLADDTMQNRQVAIKELRLPKNAGEQELSEAKTWFARESYLLSTLEHPLIPHFYSVFPEADRSYIVQEYVDGENLEQVVSRQGPFPEDEVIRWAGALCDLLIYLHNRPEPVIFRDLKPANILLRNSDASLVVVDFGIARPFQADLVGTVVGTPGYAPPEQYQGLATPQSDIYALGATLHRLVTGYDPEHEAPFTFPAVRLLNPAVSPMLAAIIERALALNPAERFSSADEMGAALGRARLRPCGTPGDAGTRPARSRRAWSGLAVAVLMAPLLLRVLAATQTPGINTSPQDIQGMYPALTDGYCTLGVAPATYGTTLAPGVSIARGIDTLWFTDQAMPAIDYLAPDGELGSCPLGTTAPAQNMISGGDGSLWIIEAGGGVIDHFTPQGAVTTYQLPPYASGAPAHMAIGSDNNLWFTQPTSDSIGRINSSGAVDEFSTNGENAPQIITPGGDGALWFTELGNRIGRITTQGTVTGFSLPERTPVGLAGITSTSDGSIWVTESTTNKVGRISADGTISEFPLPTPDADPSTIVAGPDGRCWFVEQQANKIGVITPDGQITEFAIPTANSKPAGITVGPDGNIWFTEMASQQLGRIDREGNVTEFRTVSGTAYNLANGRQDTWTSTTSIIPRWPSNGVTAASPHR